MEEVIVVGVYSLVMLGFLGCAIAPILGKWLGFEEEEE